MNTNMTGFGWFLLSTKIASALKVLRQLVQGVFMFGGPVVCVFVNRGLILQPVRIFLFLSSRAVMRGRA